MSIFPVKPRAPVQVNFRGYAYVYSDLDHTWYLEGSNPGHVDPTVFRRARNHALQVDIVSTYEGLELLNRYDTVEKEVNYRLNNINRAIDEYNQLSEIERQRSPENLDFLLNLKNQTEAILQAEDLYNITWPPEITYLE